MIYRRKELLRAPRSTLRIRPGVKVKILDHFQGREPLLAVKVTLPFNLSGAVKRMMRHL